MDLNTILKNKKVLFIPIVSMRSYETGNYNVFADGNVNRVIYKIKSSGCKYAKITLPDTSTVDSLTKLRAFCNRLRLNVDFELINFYGKNAKETRINDNIPYLNYEDFDFVVVEPTHLCYNLINISDQYFQNKLIFWNLVSNTSNKEIPFVAEYDEYNKYISSKVLTFYATPAQQQYYNNGYVDLDLFDVMEEKKTFFIPFRLSDKGYHIEELKIALDNLSKKYDFTVLFTDVNDSGIFKENDIYKKVSSDRDIYNTILKSRPIVPMLEDINDIMHMSIYEFAYFKCKMIMFEQSLIKLDNCIFIKNINELEEALEKCLN